MSRREGWLLLALFVSEAVQASEGPGPARSIFKCYSGDTTIFSDRPCDVGAEIYRTDNPVNTYTPAKIAPRSTEPASRRSRIDPQAQRRAATQAKLAESCRRIERSLRDIRSKMRAGYKVKEGERLRERQTKLREQQREARCP